MKNDERRSEGLGIHSKLHHVDPHSGEQRRVVVRTPESRGPEISDVVEGATEETLIEPVLKRMAQIKSMLEETTGKLDPASGRAAHKIPRNSDTYRGLDIEYQHLRDHVLPYQQALGRTSDAARAARPDPMAEEKQRRDAVKARAEALAIEREAEAEAAKLYEQRERARRSFG